MSKNPLIKTILDKAIRPELDKVARTVRAVIARVDEESRTVDVVYFEPKSNARRYRYGVAFADEQIGLIGRTLRNGDEVELSFREQSYQKPYISKVYIRDKSRDDLQVNNGQMISRSIDLF